MKALSSEVENKEDYKGLLVLPTGGGKTLTAVQWILKNAINNKSMNEKDNSTFIQQLSLF